MDKFRENNQEVLLQTLADPLLLNTYSLVLSAADITHRVQFVSDSHIDLYVASDLKIRAEYEIAAYESENLSWPPATAKNDYTPHFKAMSLILAGCLFAIYGQSGDWSHQGFWFLSGAGSSDAILLKSEYYRLITALTLHADLVHLLSNCILGGFVIHFLLGLTGNGLGVFLIVLTGGFANLINVLAHGPGHNFVGFSTSIFAVIGMLCSMNFSDKNRRSFRYLLMPIMSGLALLAFLGSSGPRTDLGGHFFGLVTGLAVGNVIRFKHFKVLRDSLTLQISLAIGSFAAVFLCWQAAFYR